jgi:ribosome-associated protein
MTEEDRPYFKPSCSAKKRAAKAVEDLAWQLLKLPEAELKRLPVSEEIRGELKRARKAKRHGARKRQTKHLAKAPRRGEKELETLRNSLGGTPVNLKG